MESFYNGKYKCLLDMDGVLVNWLDGICEYEKIENPYDNPINWGIGKFCDSYGCPITVKRIYEIMDQYDFWAELKPLPYYKSIIESCFKLFGKDNVSILTKPTKSANSLHGKFDWIMKYVPEFSDKFIFAIDKSFCANINHILIDDMIPNYSSFMRDGGMAYLFPTLQNRRHNFYNDYLKNKTDISNWFEYEIIQTIKGYQIYRNNELKNY